MNGYWEFSTVATPPGTMSTMEKWHVPICIVTSPGVWAFGLPNLHTFGEPPRGSRRLKKLALCRLIPISSSNSDASRCTADSKIAPLVIVGIHSLQFLHGLVPLPLAPITQRPAERPEKVLVALMAGVGQGDDMIGSTSHPGNGKDLELLVLLPQPHVELSCAVEIQAWTLLDVPHDDFAVKCVEVDEAAGVSLRSSIRTG
jgi:hypothetical protein